MSVHISEKEFREEIFSLTAVFQNVEEFQKVEKYIKQLLIEIMKNAVDFCLSDILTTSNLEIRSRQPGEGSVSGGHKCYAFPPCSPKGRFQSKGQGVQVTQIVIISALRTRPWKLKFQQLLAKKISSSRINSTFSQVQTNRIIH